MASKKPRGYGYIHKKKPQRKRPGRISKRPNKHSKNFKRKRYRGQGK